MVNGGGAEEGRDQRESEATAAAITFMRCKPRQLASIGLFVLFDKLRHISTHEHVAFSGRRKTFPDRVSEKMHQQSSCGWPAERRHRALTVSNLPPKSMFAAAAVAAATEVSGDALSLLSAQAALLFSSQRTHRWTRVTPTLTVSHWAPRPSKHTRESTCYGRLFLRYTSRLYPFRRSVLPPC